MQPHELDLTSLITGLLFTGLAAGFLADGFDWWNIRLEWVWPVLLIGLGVALLVPSRSH
ncbi:MAG: hypothetical protein ACRDJP_10990 [Actinomycetota bacterium]